MKKVRNFISLTFLVVFSILFFEVWLNLFNEYFKFFLSANGVLDTIILVIAGIVIFPILLQPKGFVLLSISPLGGIVLLTLNYFISPDSFHWKLIIFWLIAMGIVLFCKFLGMPAVEEETSFFNLKSSK